MTEHSCHLFINQTTFFAHFYYFLLILMRVNLGYARFFCNSRLKQLLLIQYIIVRFKASFYKIIYEGADA